MFQEKLELTNDLSWQGEVHIVVAEAITKIDAAIHVGHCQSLCLLVEVFTVLFVAVQMVIEKKLKHWKVCSQWVPWMLTDHHKN